MVVVDRSCFVIGRDGRLPSPLIELLLRRLDEPSMFMTAVALFDLGFPMECVVVYSLIMHGKLLLVSLKEKYSDIVFVLIVGNDNNGTPSVREETRDDGGRALPLRLVAMTALVIPFRVDNIGASVGCREDNIVFVLPNFAGNNRGWCVILK